MPGVLIRERTQRIARGIPTDTGVYFLAGLSDKGPNGTPILLQSTAEFEQYFGTRQTYSSAWDMVDTFFREGGAKLYFSRVLGPNPVIATANLLDAGAGVSLVVKAKGPGEYGNALNVAVTAGDAGGEFKLVITHDTDPTVNEVSPSLVDQAAAVAWSANSSYVNVTLGATALDPAVVAAVSLATGADDRTNATDATWLTALNAFNKDLGPGQVGYANRTTATAHGQLLTHAEATDRVALLDPADTTAKATLLSTAATIKALANARFGALFAPWTQVSALLPGGNSRSIPPSAVVAGRIALNDGNGVTPNQAAAGDYGILSSVIAINATFSDADREQLNEAGVNIIVNKVSDFKIYGFRTGAAKLTDPVGWQFGNARLLMSIKAQAKLIMEQYVLRQIDGKGILFSQLKGELGAMLNGFYEAGSLYGAEPQEAFLIDTGAAVNTPTTIANGEIHAKIELTMSPMGETVILDIVKRQLAA